MEEEDLVLLLEDLVEVDEVIIRLRRARFLVWIAMVLLFVIEYRNIMNVVVVVVYRHSLVLEW